jgi:hypothetical protein
MIRLSLDSYERCSADEFLKVPESRWLADRSMLVVQCKVRRDGMRLCAMLSRFSRAEMRLFPSATKLYSAKVIVFSAFFSSFVSISPWLNR